MIKPFRRIMATTALCAFTTTGAWADLDQSTSLGAFSSDLFGDGSESISLNPDGASVVTLTTDAIIGSGNIADITYTIVGAEFDVIVPLSSISVSAGVAAFTKTAGGAEGDSSVTFSVEIVTDVPIAATIDFVVPTLTGVDIDDPSEDVVISISSIVPTTTAPNEFPDEIETNDCDTVPDCVILVAADPYDPFDLGSGDEGEVEIDAREVIDSGGTTIDTDGAGDTRVGLLLGTHELDLEVPAPLQRDGSAWSISTGGDGVGEITLTVEGNFRDGDIVFADVTDDETIDPGESFTISGTTATLSGLALTDVEGADINVYYVPNEVDELAPEVFTFTAVIDYALASNIQRPADPQTNPGEIVYDGIDVEGYAYGVVRQGGTDRSFVRVTNEDASINSVFFSCTDDAGNSTFGDFGFLGANETEAFDSDEIGAIMGTFTGRAACDILSDGDLSVQHKIRSSDILTDNSPVVGRQLRVGSSPD